MCTRPWTETDRKLADIMSTYWANFARTGDVNGPGVPLWPRYSIPARRVMRLGEKVEAISAPHKAELDFFDAWNARR
jgi:para-nitrobenzyl esterase